MLRLFNTKTRKVEEFKTENDPVKIYTCGPTVYNYAHIGNFSAYIYWDLLIRTLKANGYNVKRVLNFTDVGHLASDADEGEDKLEKGAAREGKTVWEIADFYEKAFLKDFNSLNLTPPEVIARATDYIKQSMAAVDQMTKNGFTYETTDGIYFDTAKFPAYADFARLDLKGLKAGARIAMSSEKKNPSDFAVWMFIKPGEKHAMRWDYLGRPGYPGWHLECSVIIHTELGEPIDIHTGGIDHLPIHHTNEVAQTFALTGHELSHLWLHNDFITIEGEKISKSLGNIYTLADLKAKNFSPLDYKMWILSGHYQGARNFTFDALAAAQARRLHWRNRIALCYQVNQNPNSVFPEILDAVNDNLNSAKAFALIDESDLNLDDWQKIDDLFGLDLISSTPDISPEVKAKIAARAEAKKLKDYEKSDIIRNELKDLGIALSDTKGQTFWEYLK